MTSVDGTSVAGGDSEDDIDWEEIDVPQQRDIEITLQARSQKDVTKKKNASHAERLVRIDCHKIHTVCLLANASVRNRWINDPLLHARLLSLTPLPLQNAFAMIHKSRVPDQNKRGRLFETAITHLVEWWSSTYFEVYFTGHIRNCTFDEIHKRVAGLSLEALLDFVEAGEESEVIRSPNSLMKHVLMRGGSRDASAQLFTALCRALGIPARLVVSLQSVPWQARVGKPRTKPKAGGRKHDKGAYSGKGKERAVEGVETDERSDDNMEEIDTPGTPSGRDVKGKAKEGLFAGEGQRLDGGTVNIDKGKSKEKAKPVINLRKTKGKGQKLGAPSASRMQALPDPTTTPPVFWTEVFSRADTRWLPVDPIRSIINKRKVFDPSTDSTSAMKQENRMLYVVAFEEDGYARDVTPRYAKEYAAKVAKAQGAGERLGRRKEWWERVLGLVTRPYRLLRDDLEDEELQETQLREGMPTSMAGFKDHPLYVLSRHLRRDEVIYPLTELGKFRGEPVYSRSSVFALKTAENWMRSGHKVKEGCQPMKWVKQRAATVNKRREIEIAMELGRAGGGGGVGEGTEGGVMQGLYAKNQTEFYIPDPIINGKVPKNDFGNIDLYVPSMLPEGGAHVPFFEVKGVVKIARKLGFDYAEAVTGFEFKKRKAFPVVQGVVVAAENEAALLEAYWEAEEYADEKARIKLQDRVIKRWTRLVQGLRLRKRLQEQYGAEPGREGTHVVDKGKGGHVEVVHDQQGGGFLLAADDVVEPYHLPKYQHVVPPSPPVTQTESVKDYDEPMGFEEVNEFTLETIEDNQDEVVEEVLLPLPLQTNGLPKTMQQMAEEAARHQRLNNPAESPLEHQPSVTSVSTKAPSRMTSRGNSTPSAKGKVTSKPRPKRKRIRRENSGSVSDTEAESRPSPVKRGRDSTVTVVTPAPTGRVLRPRVSKNASKIQEENEQEEAFRRAVGD